MNTNSHGSPIPSESERKQERKRREETGLANSVRGGGAPARSPVPERTDDDGRWRAVATVDRGCESESEAASESRRRGGRGMGIRVRVRDGGSGQRLIYAAAGGVSELSARWRSAGEATGAREDGRRWSMESGGGGGSRMRERE